MIEQLGCKCKICGSTENLEFDHIDPSTKEFTICSKWSSSVHKDKLESELKKCQLLCKQCHLLKTKEQKKEYFLTVTWNHGTVYAWMKKKCTCDICIEAKNTFNDLRNKKRRLKDDPRGPYNKEAECGSTLKYNRGCRCQKCKKANADCERLRKLSKRN